MDIDPELKMRWKRLENRSANVNYEEPRSTFRVTLREDEIEWILKAGDRYARAGFDTFHPTFVDGYREVASGWEAIKKKLVLKRD